MSISIHDMEMTATSLPDIGISSNMGGNTIEVNDIHDDLGMGLLANNRYSGGGGGSSNGVRGSGSSGGSGGGGNGGNSVSVGFSGGGLDEIDIQKMETSDTMTFDLGGSGSQPIFSIQREQPTFQPANTFGSDGSFANTQSGTGPSIQMSSQTVDPQKEILEKADYINKLQRLEAKGFPVSKRFTMDNSLHEIKTEYTRLVDARQLETSIRFQRNMMMGLVTGVEWMNNKFDPFDLKLDGWSEGVHENIEDYDDIFEELYDKYKERGKMPPEARLMFQLAGSGFMCHVTNSFFRSKMPSADDIFKKNPELAKQFAAAAASSASPGFGNFMGMAMGVPPGTASGGQGAASASGQGAQAPPQPMGVPINMASGPGAFFNSPQMPQNVAAAPSPKVVRRDMSGPSGVDDILKTFEEVRRAEEQVQEGGGFQMPFQRQQQQQQQQSSDMQSLGSDDLGSVGTSATGNRRGRRRAAPVGNVVSLNV